MTTTPAQTPGERLRAAVVELCDLVEHERLLLAEAALTADLCADLQRALDAGGPLVEGPQGLRAHPAAVELRQQRVTLARLLAALRVPVDDDGSVTAGPRLQRRGPRGVYGMGAA